MKSKIELLFNQASRYEFDRGALKASGHLTFEQGKAVQIDFDAGNLVLQSYSNYLVYVEHYDFEVTQTAIVDVKIKDSGLFLFSMLSGSSIFEDHTGRRISETDGNSCALVYLRSGLYRRVFMPGRHKLLSLTYRDEFFLKRAEYASEFTPLIRAYLMKDPFCSLAQCPISISLYNRFKKINAQAEQISALKFDDAIQQYASDCLQKYQEHLSQDHFDLNTSQKKKLQEISEYLKENYASENSKSIPFLTREFSVSESTLRRLIRKAFQMPLNKYVNELRLSHSVNALTSSNETVATIAKRVGFEDQHYFSRIFKQRFGFSPKQTRSL